MVSLCLDNCRAYLPLFLIFLSGLGFSLQGLVIKHLGEAYNFHGSYELILVRGFIQITVSCCFIYNNRRNGEVAKLFGDTPLTSMMLLTRAILGFIGMSFSFLSIEHMPLADSSVILMQSPIVAACLGWFVLGEPWRLAEFTATFISMIGTVLITRPPFIFNALGIHVASDGENYNSAADRFGPLYGVIAAFAAGGSFVVVRMLGTTVKMPWANVSLAASLGQFVLSIPFVFLSGQGLLTSSTPGIVWLLLVGGGCIGTVSQIMMTYGMQREKSASAAGMRSSDIFFAFVWEAWFTNDTVTALSVTGALLVLLGVMIIVLFKSSTLATTTTTTGIITEGNKSAGGSAGVSMVLPMTVLDNSTNDNHNSANMTISNKRDCYAPISNGTETKAGGGVERDRDEGAEVRKGGAGSHHGDGDGDGSGWVFNALLERFHVTIGREQKQLYQRVDEDVELASPTTAGRGCGSDTSSSASSVGPKRDCFVIRDEEEEEEEEEDGGDDDERGQDQVIDFSSSLPVSESPATVTAALATSSLSHVARPKSASAGPVNSK